MIPEFSKYHTVEDKKRIGCQTIDNSLFTITKKGKKYFKPSNIFCHECKYHDVVKNGTYSRKLIFLIYG